MKLIGFLGAAWISFSAIALAGNDVSAPLDFPTSPLIMLTAFEPFGGSPVNNSAAIAQAIRDKVQGNLKVNVRVCILPVVYDKAAEAAEKCYQSLPKRPDMVISLGEHYLCEIRVETRAHNLDSSFSPDNADQVRSDAKIDNGPEEEGLSLPLPSMYCGLNEKQRTKLTASNNPGNYVCNNTAYHLEKYFSKEAISYGFIHVPNTSCSEETKNPDLNATVISDLIEFGLPKVSSTGGTTFDQMKRAGKHRGVFGSSRVYSGETEQGKKYSVDCGWLGCLAVGPGSTTPEAWQRVLEIAQMRDDSAMQKKSVGKDSCIQNTEVKMPVDPSQIAVVEDLTKKLSRPACEGEFYERLKAEYR